jgi:hypothetical protein
VLRPGLDAEVEPVADLLPLLRRRRVLLGDDVVADRPVGAVAEHRLRAGTEHVIVGSFARRVRFATLMRPSAHGLFRHPGSA